MKIKVCGINDIETARRMEQKVRPDFLGFIFYAQSPRMVSQKTLEGIHSIQTPKVGVFVDESEKNIDSAAKKYSLQMIQLHGNESLKFCMSLKNKGLKVIKAFGVSSEKDIDTVETFKNSVDFFLFDTKTKKHGGSGKKFDWEILEPLDQMGIPFFLSGGITPKDGTALKNLKFKNLFGVDINSRFEEKPGLKNINLVETFAQSINEK